MQPMPHAYTNATTGNGILVRKVYQGPDAPGRCERETAALKLLDGWLPVPPVLRSGDGELEMGLLPGVQGQQLIADGLASDVLRACGRMLHRLHAVDLNAVCDAAGHPSGSVLVHGDYGPNNVLLDPNATQVTAVLDWEWAHIGEPLEDLAWCEWIVRTMHPEHLDALDGFFGAYGHRPTWTDRHHAMIAKCHRLVDFWQRWQPGGDRTRHRRDQLAGTIAWTE